MLVSTLFHLIIRVFVVQYTWSFGFDFSCRVKLEHFNLWIIPVKNQVLFAVSLSKWPLSLR